MDAIELNRLILKDDCMKAVTWGVFARDELPQFPLLPGAYVVNSHERPGQHWFLIFVGDGIEMYDSLGRKPIDYELHFPCQYFHERIQEKNSNTCGLYVLYFLYWRCRGIDMFTLINSLTLNNEKIVKDHYIWLQSI